jgi:hypothetical protein
VTVLKFCIVTCDGDDGACGEEGPPFPTMIEARWWARNNDWRSGPNDEEHLCPRCQEKLPCPKSDVPATKPHEEIKCVHLLRSPARITANFTYRPRSACGKDLGPQAGPTTSDPSEVTCTGCLKTKFFREVEHS